MGTKRPDRGSGRLLSYIGVLCGPLAGALIAVGALRQIRKHRVLLDSGLVLWGFALALLGTVLLALGHRLARARPRRAASTWTPLRTIIGGANVPTTTMRLNATWPFAVLELGEARFRLRLRGVKLFGALTLDAGPADVTDVYPVKGKLGTGVGFTDHAGRDYYFWTAAGLQILYGLAYYGFPVSGPHRSAAKAWTLQP